MSILEGSSRIFSLYFDGGIFLILVKRMRKYNFLGKMDVEVTMKMSLCTEAQIMSVLREAEDGMPVP